jgi:hypothetical protein
MYRVQTGGGAGESSGRFGLAGFPQTDADSSVTSGAAWFAFDVPDLFAEASRCIDDLTLR